MPYKNKEKQRQYLRDWRKEHPNYSNEWRASNAEHYAELRRREPRKHLARVKVYYAVKRGELIKLPCEVCGDEKTEAHHEDYEKPLEVIWLCRQHHEETHHPIQ